MRAQTLDRWTHDHSFGQEIERAGEGRTKAVIVITAAMMALEVSAGIAFGSMALLADGMHMASHASALTISALAYYYTRKHARDERFNFGTGKINSLAGFASAIVLVSFAGVMAWESVGRILEPVAIDYRQSLIVAVLGLAVNAACLLILGAEDHEHGRDRHDHNLWSAYLHVMADAMTSVLAIAALLAGRYYGLAWMDPLMGILGAGLVSRWSWGLMRSTGHVLLDMKAPPEILQAIRSAIEAGGDRISDLHVWSVGPGIYSAEVGVVSSSPREPAAYRSLLSKALRLAHVTIEVQRCPRGGSDGRPDMV
ncbi:MAG: cation transporter [Elusimicrobia bacterium]|nr:cation transporter [Elusimicrobiota bacterium]